MQKKHWSWVKCQEDLETEKKPKGRLCQTPRGFAEHVERRRHSNTSYP